MGVMLHGAEEEIRAFDEIISKKTCDQVNLNVRDMKFKT